MKSEGLQESDLLPYAVVGLRNLHRLEEKRERRRRGRKGKEREGGGKKAGGGEGEKEREKRGKEKTRAHKGETIFFPLSLSFKAIGVCFGILKILTTTL